MQHFQRINVEQSQQLIEKGAVIADIRDENAFNTAHIPNAIQLTNGSLNHFLSQTDENTPVIVVCYHGISSQPAAEYLTSQGLEEVYSMDGGFEAWRNTFPEEVTSL
jgi:thiosulfate sulfurtransferase